MHAAHSPRRCGAARCHRWGTSSRHQSRRQRRCAGRNHRRNPSASGEPAARVGSQPAGDASVGRPRVRRRELERLDRPRRDRPTFWQRRLERDSCLAQFCCDRVTISRRHRKIHSKIHHDPNCTAVGWHYRLWAEPQLRAVFYYPLWSRADPLGFRFPSNTVHRQRINFN